MAREKKLSKKKQIAKDKLLKRASNICERIMRRLKEEYNYRVKLEESNLYSVIGKFCGYASSVNLSKIELSLFFSNEEDIKLREWDANIVICFIHEICHWKIYKRMSLKERIITDNHYLIYSTFRDSEEWVVWDMTIQILKKLGYHNSKSIRQAFERFDKPEGYTGCF